MDIPIGQFELVAVGDLIPYARNSRVHTPAQVSQITRRYWDTLCSLHELNPEHWGTCEEWEAEE